MASITIRDVPDDILTAVKAHAAQAGQSLQTYVLGLLTHDAEQTPNSLPTKVEGEERMRQAREELEAAGIAVTEETMRKAREGELFTRLQAVRATTS